MKFLGAAIIAWVGFRAVTMSAVPIPPSAGEVGDDKGSIESAATEGLPPIEQLEAQAQPLPNGY